VVDTMVAVREHLKGRFVIMVLIAKGRWLMAGSHDYPLALSKDNKTVYFGTDINTLAQYYPSEITIDRKRKSAIFCTTSFPFDIFSQVAY
jgi:glucosamine 6-phosphate synthetase-like amidotransferase/phosphosugar isomerase protein